MPENHPVLAEVRRLEPRSQPQAPVTISKDTAQVAIVAASGVLAGAVAARVVGRRRRRKRAKGLLEIVSSKSFLVDVHLVDRK
jgi:hypothetical protein